MTQDPVAFQLCIDIFVKRYSGLAVDAIAGLDARGFVLGPPIALALKLPFIMIRKKGKLPNAVTGEEYRKEYSGANSNGGDELCISRTAIKEGARVLVIDDLVATGVSKNFTQQIFISNCCILLFVDGFYSIYPQGHPHRCRGPAESRQCHRQSTHAPISHVTFADTMVAFLKL